MSDKQPEESLDDIMASLEAATPKIPPRYPGMPMSAGKPRRDSDALPAPKEPFVNTMTEVEVGELLKQVEAMGEEPVCVEQCADYEPELRPVRSFPLPTGWIPVLFALLVCVVIFGGLAMYVWSQP